MSININPSLWGSSAWRFMHYITLSYPDNPTKQDKQNIYTFFIVTQKLLPCEKCRNEFDNKLKENPLDDDVLSSRTNLVKWLLLLHNNVNKSLGKDTMSYDQFINTYTVTNNSDYSSHDIFNMSLSAIMICFIIIIILILVLIMRLKNN